MVNSLDRDLLDQAAELINAAAIRLQSGDQWQVEAVRWLASAAAAGVKAPSKWGGADVGSRWRPIDKDANVAPDPAPENPDDPDEGETGPPEQTG